MATLKELLQLETFASKSPNERHKIPDSSTVVDEGADWLKSTSQEMCIRNLKASKFKKKQSAVFCTDFIMREMSLLTFLLLENIFHTSKYGDHQITRYKADLLQALKSISNQFLRQFSFEIFLNLIFFSMLHYNKNKMFIVKTLPASFINFPIFVTLPKIKYFIGNKKSKFLVKLLL